MKINLKTNLNMNQANLSRGIQIDNFFTPFESSGDSSFSKVFQAWILKYDQIIYPFLVWLVSLIMVVITVEVFTNIIGEIYNFSYGFPSPMGRIETYAAGFNSWDGLFFEHIAQYGYQTKLMTPYFPLLPLLMNLLHRVTTLSYVHCGLLVVNLSYLIALMVFYRLALVNMGQEIARRTLWLIMIFPTAFYFNVLYTEAMTLLTTILFFYFLSNNDWYKAMMSGFFASAAHTLGVVVILSGFCFLIRHRQALSVKQFWCRFFSLGIIAMGLLTYMIFLYFKFNNPFMFLTAEAYWHRTFTFPLVNVLQSLWVLMHNHLLLLTSAHFISFVNIFATLIIVMLGGVMCFSYRKHLLFTIEMKLFFIITLLICLCSGAHHGSVESYARFMVVLFPAFLVWADKLKNATLFLYTFIFMVMLKIMMTGIFASGLNAINEKLF